MHSLYATIKRQFLSQILSGEKRIEYRAVKPYWTNRLSRVELPFALKVVSGYKKNSPSAVLLINRISIQHVKLMDAIDPSPCYALHIAKIISSDNI